jgi:AcrR family transcriptional regulator
MSAAAAFDSPFDKPFDHSLDKSSHALRNKASTTTEKGLGRAQEILQVARGLLASKGYAGLSMRSVASAAGMSLSNVQHYYASKEQLLEALLLTTMDEFQAKMDRISAAMAGRPQVERFLTTVDMFLDEITEPTMHAISSKSGRWLRATPLPPA